MEEDKKRGRNSTTGYLRFLLRRYAHQKKEAKLSQQLHLSNFSKLNLVEVNCTHNAARVHFIYLLLFF